MKKPHTLLITVLLIITLAGCTMPVVTTTPSTPVTDVTTTSSLIETSAPVVVTFADPVMEAMIRGSMGKTQSDITLAEAQAVTRLNLSNELQSYISGETPIKGLSGLEAFSTLKSLDLSQNAVSDISPLAGLTKLTLLSLAGNPVADVSPLAELTNLKLLMLSGSQAPEYSALASLVNLQVLMLDNSTISDLSPLAGLTNLRQLHLANTSVEDLAPLESIYANLTDKDFAIATTLAELGFNMDSNSHQAFYDSEDASFYIHHIAWGPAPAEWDENIIRISAYVKDEYKVSIGYYGVHKAYVCSMINDGGELMNYVYNTLDGSFNLDEEKRPGVEEAIRAAFDVREGEDPLLAPVRYFDEIVKSTFNMTPQKLFALPYAPPTLVNLGFYPDEESAVYLFEQRGPREVNLEIHRPEWGERDFDLRFFTPLSDYYRLVITYHIADNKLEIGFDDNDQGGAKFVYYFETGEFNDEWVSDNEITVEEYIKRAFDDPEMEDPHQRAVDLIVQYFQDTFGMTMDELYALPTGE